MEVYLDNPLIRLRGDRELTFGRDAAIRFEINKEKYLIRIIHDHIEVIKISDQNDRINIQPVSSNKIDIK